MGREVDAIQARFADGADIGRLQWEAPRLIFRGASRRVFEGEALKNLVADGGDLVLADGSRFTLGRIQAGRWVAAISNPPGRLDKLGVRPGLRVAVVNLADPDFAAELAGRVSSVNTFNELDILFFGADSSDELARIPDLVPKLAPRGALWIVSLKGKLLRVKDVEVMAAAKAHGLVDNKVCAFSDTRTALRFTSRL
ncbi:MAG: DUF3052 domain-containing protein [Caulobacter sp.]|nr:DUF3052 domain-containing protein [Caulobacter sp.]